jgi:leucine dehydrogenase
MSSSTTLTPFALIEQRGHEHVSFFYDQKTGVRGIVAIHSTVLGPSLGGCRMRQYENETAALDDALRLAEGMTYKSALAGLDLGGGKAVLMADNSLQGAARRALFLRFGEFIHRLSGTYITAEDMGTGVEDVMIMRERTPYVAGIDPACGGGGDPSPWTALGVYQAIVAAAAIKFGSEDLSSRVVAVQGLGHVGENLVRILREHGVTVVGTDVNRDRCERVAQQYGITIVTPDKIYSVPADIFAPCAAGQIINATTLPQLTCSIIAGAANNQLSDDSMRSALRKRDILYCPDFVINSGGVINVGAEYVAGGYKESWVREKVMQIGATTKRVLTVAHERSEFPEVVAIALARERIERESQRKSV